MRQTPPEPHLDGRCGRPISPWTLWNTRGFAHGRFRRADAGIHGAGLTAPATSAAAGVGNGRTGVAAIKCRAKRADVPDASVVFRSAPSTATSGQPKG